MEDVVTDAPPPSRFSPDDLDNFAAPPPNPTPILVVSPNPIPAPRLLIVLISPTSLALLPHLPSAPPLHTSLLLPDLPLQQSHAPIRIYLHNPTGALLAAAQGAVPAHRARRRQEPRLHVPAGGGAGPGRCPERGVLCLGLRPTPPPPSSTLTASLHLQPRHRPAVLLVPPPPSAMFVLPRSATRYHSHSPQLLCSLDALYIMNCAFEK